MKRPEIPPRVRVPAAILLVAAVVAVLLLWSAPETQRIAQERAAPVVEVVPVEVLPYDRTVEAFGTVVPAREVSLSPEVEGRVVEVHEHLDPGGRVGAGDVIVRIDTAEYELAVSAAQADLAEARAALAIERGRQQVASREWELFGDVVTGGAEASPEGRDLALRVPQLRQAEARVAVARSAVERARLDLERTVIRAPFDALVRTDAVEVGQRIGPGTEIAVLVGTKAFWVRASLPLSQMGAVMAARDAAVSVSLASGLTDSAQHEGRLVRSLGEVDPQGRMAQVLVEVLDPLGMAEQDAGAPIPLGSYVRVALPAGRLDAAVVVPRGALRENGELWVSDGDDQLRVRHARILWSQGDELAVHDAFEPGDRVIVSPLPDVIPGMTLRSRTRASALSASEVADGDASSSL